MFFLPSNVPAHYDYFKQLYDILDKTVRRALQRFIHALIR